MVDKEKVVITLLLITIILSLVSVIVTFSFGDRKVDTGNGSGFVEHDDRASVSLVVQPPAAGGAG